MKKFIAGILVGVTLSMSTVVLAESNTTAQGYFYNFKVLINGEEKKLDKEPVVIGDSSYLPVRAISEALGYKVQYETATETISLSNDGKSYVMDESVTTPAPVSSGTGHYVADMEAKYSKNGKLDAGLVKAALDTGELTVNSQDEATGDSLLILCIKKNNFSVYDLFRKNSALDPQLPNKDGKTPLHVAVIAENDFFFGELVSKFYVKTKVKDNDGKMPIDYVKEDSSFYVSLIGKRE